MKFLGIDYGTRRIGLALSDDTATLAFPHKIVENTPKAINEVLEVIKNESVGDVVLGDSKDFKGGDNTVTKEVMAFKEVLEAGGLIVHLEPEFLTSVEARRDAPKRTKTDDSAAALILQRYLERLKNTK